MKYYIGLDIGTSSVGWAVTDERYHLVRKKGKDMWGARLFDEANTAAERRSFRTARRRLNREKARIAYVKEIFGPEIAKVDPGFYQRLDDSKYVIDDKTEHQPFALFADTGYTDREYYAQYPTIFHLRKELVESEDPHDVRLVYLAVLNMFKHRGHFLNPNLDGDAAGNLSEPLDGLRTAVYEQLELEFPLPDDIGEIEQSLTDRSKTAGAKREAITAFLEIDKKNKPLIEIWKLICGLKGRLSDIFADESESFSEDQKKLSVSFRDGNYEETEGEIEEMLSPESFDLFLTIKQVHDAGVLATIMQGDDESYEYLSQAKVASYEKHKRDLRILKEVYRTYMPEKYDEMFRIMTDNNYSAYIGHVNAKESIKEKQGRAKVRRGAKDGDFFKTVKKQIENIEGHKDIEAGLYILGEIEKDSFLPKQLTTDNGVIPYQVHMKELKAILKNAENYLPFLKETDPDYGLTATERLLELFEFRIPYYVGPLKGTEHSNSWVVRKEEGQILPWNINDKIDEKATSQKFIENLIRHCTYLADEKVMPKSSLMYEKFMLLNELNNLKIHEEKISPELKQEIYRELFRKSGKRVTNKKLVSWLKAQGVLEADETEDALSGYDKETGGFTNTLANYHKFTEVFGTEVLTDRQIEIAEDIIFYSTVYGDSGSFLKERITEKYGDELSPAQIKRVLGYKFKDWGNLSREFLLLEGADTATGEIKPLLIRMWDENENLSQLVKDPDRFTYFEVLAARTKTIEKTLREVTHEDLTDLYISAPVRRMVWQTIRIVQEIEKVMGEEPARIFVEMTRSKEKDKGRTVSRKKQLQDLYKNCGEDVRHLAEEIEQKDEAQFRIKKLYLYYRQKGRCMYSGEPISLEKLFDDNFYDIDHIYPRHYVKDDSIENNLVLVKAELNREKTDEYPIDTDIRHHCAGMWKSLRDGGFINEEKYKRLTRTQPFSEEERIGFINRQLVETGQGTKAVAEILTQVFSGGKANDKVVYVKAGNVSAFRNEVIKHHKCREVNDFHHANDAYLNIVVGNTYFTKFTRNARNFFKENYKSESGTRNSAYHMAKIFQYTVARGDVLAWDPQMDIVTVKKMMAKNTPIVTRRSYEAKGGISDQQIVGADAIRKAKGVGYIPIKASDPRLADTCQYGGFNKVSGAYFFLVEHVQKKKTVRTIENMPLYLTEKYKGKEGIEAYCREVLGLKNPSVRWEKIRMGSLLKINGFYTYLTGRTGNNLMLRNAVELCLTKTYMDYFREIVKVVESDCDEAELLLRQERRSKDKENKQEDITAKRNLELYDELLVKHTNGIYGRRVNPIGSKLTEGRDKFIELTLDRQCYVLYQILQISQPVSKADLRDIGFSKETGTSKPSKNITDLKECKLILQSVTGLYKQEIDLLIV